MKSLLLLSQESFKVLVPVISLVAGVAGFSVLNSLHEPPTPIEAEEPVPLVETIPAVLREGQMEIEADGMVVPYREVTLAAEVAGRVTWKSEDCRPGNVVSKDTPLFEIDPRSYELEVERLAKEADQAVADINQLAAELKGTEELAQLAEEQVSLEKRQLSRLQSLFERKVATDTELDKARQNELSARNNLVNLRKQVQMQRAQQVGLQHARELALAKLERAKLDLSRTKIVSPVVGVVANCTVEQDNYVQPGTALVTIEDTSAVEVRCLLRMDELRWLRQQGAAGTGQEVMGADYTLPPVPVKIAYRVGPREYLWNGVLDRYDGIGLDERTRTAPVRIRVPEPREVILPPGQPGPPGVRALMRGMYVRVMVQAPTSTPLIELPEEAVRPGNRVWRKAGDTLQIVPVNVAQLAGGRVLVEPSSGGLQPGDEVIVSPLPVVTDGMRVRQSSAAGTAPSHEPGP